MTNVTALPGVRNPASGPDEALVEMLKGLVERAESGELLCFIGVGFCADGGRLSAWADHHDNFYEMLGSLVTLQREYEARHPEVP